MQSIAAAVVAVVHAPVGVVKMPKFYRQNKKRIDPRYFLNETAMSEEYDDRVTTAMAHLASGVMCENPDLANWGHYMSDLRWRADGRGS